MRAEVFELRTEPEVFVVRFEESSGRSADRTA
jgi:hypothetical protein